MASPPPMHRAATPRLPPRLRNAWISEERGFAQGFENFVEDWRDDTGHEAEE